MPKEGAVGDGFYVQGYVLSGDVRAVNRIGGGPALLDMTSLAATGVERLGGRFDGEISWRTMFNPDAGRAHVALSGLPTTDVIVSYRHGGSVGGPAAGLVAKQVDYPWEVGDDGSLLATIQAVLANGYRLEWLQQLTAGRVVHASATNGASLDGGAVGTPTNFGASAYLQSFSLGSGTANVVVQDSADNVSFATVTGLSFAAITGTGRTAERVITSPTQQVRRYVRVASTGTFTNLDFWVGFIRHLTATL
jgi:hypothetical protein